MVTRKVIGQVTPEEKNEILHLFERRNGLNELVGCPVCRTKNALD